MNIKKVTDLINSTYTNDVNNITIRRKYTKIIISKIKINQEKQFFEKDTKKRKKIEVKQKKEIHSDKEQKTEYSHLYSTIISPMVGTFYQSPAPNEPTFIEIGDIVKPKQTVCIIEAMKLMNEIESEVEGEIAEILVKNGDIVDCGQALIKIKTK